jgi:hypothetical protein
VIFFWAVYGYEPSVCRPEFRILIHHWSCEWARMGSAREQKPQRIVSFATRAGSTACSWKTRRFPCVPRPLDVFLGFWGLTAACNENRLMCIVTTQTWLTQILTVAYETFHCWQTMAMQSECATIFLRVHPPRIVVSREPRREPAGTIPLPLPVGFPSLCGDSQPAAFRWEFCESIPGKKKITMRSSHQ